jgi:hypothetical protein
VDVLSPLHSSSDESRDRGAGEYHDERLAVDLAQLADGGEQDGEHKSEHPGRRREGAHQPSPGWR